MHALQGWNGRSDHCMCFAIDIHDCRFFKAYVVARSHEIRYVLVISS